MRRQVVLFVVALLVLGAAIGYRIWSREGPPTIAPSETSNGGPTASPSPGAASPTASATATGPTREEIVATLTDPDEAARRSLDDLRTLVRAGVDEGVLAGAVTPSWRPAVARDVATWPVIVGRARLGDDGAVHSDVLIATDMGGRDLVLRMLAAASALGDDALAVTATVDGVAVTPEIDRTGARLLLPIADDARADGEIHVRVTSDYRIPERSEIADDGSPAGFGLLARSEGVAALGHWLPLLTLPTDDGPMQPRGDVGAFPAAAFSLIVEHPGILVTGGTETACPTLAEGSLPTCTWVQGLGVRDVSAALLTTGVITASDGTVVVTMPTGTATQAAADAGAEEANDDVGALAARFGDLPWPEVDVVTVPMDPGALGMEFPGMVWVDPGAWPEAGPELGSYVLAHEVGHQWFHALVGNGSLSAPVIDESLAQYLSYLVFADEFSQAAADGLAARSFGGRHDRAVEEGVPDEAPAQPLSAFASSRSYGAAVYGRGGQTWVDAERVAGRDAVTAVVRALVDRYGLGVVDVPTVMEVAEEVDPDVAAALREGWGVGA